MVSRQLEKQLFELKFAAKSLERNSRKSTRLEGEERQKVKKAMEKGNLEGARIHAEAAIRLRNESLHLLQLSNRVDAMASQLSSSMSMKNVLLLMSYVCVGEYIHGKGRSNSVQGD